MPKGLSRWYGLGHLHFITCSCRRRLPLFTSSQAKNLFVKILGEVRDRYGFKLVGYVVMPEHIHLLIGEPATGTISTVMQGLKQRVSRLSHIQSGTRVSPQRSQPRPRNPPESFPPFWQPRFYDFNVWSQKKIAEKLQYMHLNPVKRILVADSKDWPWSSYLFYAQKEPGLIRIDPIP